MIKNVILAAYRPRKTNCQICKIKETTIRGNPNLARANAVVAGTIWAAQFYPVGEFQGHTEANGLRIWIFPTTNDWDIIKTHVDVFVSPCDFPQTGPDPCPGGTWDEFTTWGNPKIGHFRYGDDSVPCRLEGHSIFIPYSEIC